MTDQRLLLREEAIVGLYVSAHCIDLAAPWSMRHPHIPVTPRGYLLNLSASGKKMIPSCAAFLIFNSSASINETWPSRIRVRS